MEIINVPRAFGKTTNLIMRAVKTGYPIIVGTSSQKNVLKDQIRRITDKEVEVYTVYEFCDKDRFRGSSKPRPENVLIDELPIVLSVMLNANVDMATMTSRSIERYDMMVSALDKFLISFGEIWRSSKWEGTLT